MAECGVEDVFLILIAYDAAADGDFREQGSKRADVHGVDVVAAEADCFFVARQILADERIHRFDDAVSRRLANPASAFLVLSGVIRGVYVGADLGEYVELAYVALQERSPCVELVVRDRAIGNVLDLQRAGFDVVEKLGQLFQRYIAPFYAAILVVRVDGGEIHVFFFKLPGNALSNWREAVEGDFLMAGIAAVSKGKGLVRRIARRLHRGGIEIVFRRGCCFSGCARRIRCLEIGVVCLHLRLHAPKRILAHKVEPSALEGHINVSVCAYGDIVGVSASFDYAFLRAFGVGKVDDVADA